MVVRAIASQKGRCIAINTKHTGTSLSEGEMITPFQKALTHDEGTVE